MTIFGWYIPVLVLVLSLLALLLVVASWWADARRYWDASKFLYWSAVVAAVTASLAAVCAK